MVLHVTSLDQWRHWLTTRYSGTGGTSSDADVITICFKQAAIARSVIRLLASVTGDWMWWMQWVYSLTRRSIRTNRPAQTYQTLLEVNLYMIQWGQQWTISNANSHAFCPLLSSMNNISTQNFGRTEYFRTKNERLYVTIYRFTLVKLPLYIGKALNVVGFL